MTPQYERILRQYYNAVDKKHLILFIHYLLSIYFKVTGHFSGELKNGDHVEVDFIDTHTFSPHGKTINRITEFPNDQQNI